MGRCKNLVKTAGIREHGQQKFECIGSFAWVLYSLKKVTLVLPSEGTRRKFSVSCPADHFCLSTNVSNSNPADHFQQPKKAPSFTTYSPPIVHIIFFFCLRFLLRKGGEKKITSASRSFKKSAT